MEDVKELLENNEALRKKAEHLDDIDHLNRMTKIDPKWGGNLNQSVPKGKFGKIMKDIPFIKASGPEIFAGKFFLTFWEEEIPTLLNLSKW